MARLATLPALGPLRAAPWLPLGASRLLSTTAAAVAGCTTLEEQLAAVPWVQLLKVPGQGRGLFAATDLEQGMVVHAEAPMLAAPSPHALDSTCHQCLRPLPAGRAAPAAPALGSSLRFCSDACRGAAQQAWARVAAACDLAPLQAACRASGSKFPLMVAQLAALRLQQELSRTAGGSSSSSSGSSSSGGGVQAAAGVCHDAPLRGDPLTQLRHLCFVNVEEPPPAWAELHELLLRGLQPLCSASSSSSSGLAGLPLSSDWLQRELSLRWFSDALARLHVNAFRVDTVPPLDRSDPSALLRAAAASLAGAAAPAHATGSAAFLLGSMLNHSCAPNLDVQWPENNGEVAFTAARDIARGEQLTISYVDSEQGVAARQDALAWGYGFSCQCQRCVEEGAAAGGSPP